MLIGPVPDKQGVAVLAHQGFGITCLMHRYHAEKSG
jgi:hypothetical protein